MNNYANNVFEATDTIISQRLSELSFDRTINCKIIEEVKDKPNTYWVSNDNIRFQAIAQDGKKYSAKEEVFVLIPNGEYSNEKIIIGSRIDNSKDGYNKMKYISTKEQFVEYNTINFGTQNCTITTSTENDGIKFSEDLISKVVSFPYSIGLERIGLAFSIDSLGLFNNNQEQGIYGIGLNLYKGLEWNKAFSTPFSFEPNEKLKTLEFNDCKEYLKTNNIFYNHLSTNNQKILLRFQEPDVEDEATIGIYLCLDINNLQLHLYKIEAENSFISSGTLLNYNNNNNLYSLSYSEIVTFPTIAINGVGEDLGNWEKVKKYFKQYNEENIVDSQILFSTELYGNPYAFTEQFKHFILLPLHIEEKDVANSFLVKIQLLEYSNFQQIKDIKLSNVSLSFGFEKDSENIGKSRLILGNDQSLEYSNSDSNLSRDIYLQWNRDNIIYNYLNPDIPNDYTVDWFKYEYTWGDKSYYGFGIDDDYKTQEINLNLWNWKKITPSSSFVLSDNLDVSKAKQQFKVIISKQTIQEEKYFYDFIEVEGLAFDNINLAEPSGAVGEGNGLRLELDQGNTGVYNLYGLDGKIDDRSYLKNYNIYARITEVLAENEEISEIKWKFPQDNTMVVDARLKLENGEPAVADLTAQYTINSEYIPGAMNNRIWCFITLTTGKELSASLTLQFGQASTFGTEYSLNLDFMNNKNCLYVKEQGQDADTLKVKATILHKLNNIITDVTKNFNIQWSWMYTGTKEEDGEQKEDADKSISDILKIEDPNKNNEITLKYEKAGFPRHKIINDDKGKNQDKIGFETIQNGENVFNDKEITQKANYSILVATVEGVNIQNKQTIKLIDYLPIPIASKPVLVDNNNSEINIKPATISGATRIVYGSSNTDISYSKNPYTIQDEYGETYDFSKLSLKENVASVKYLQKTMLMRLADPNRLDQTWGKPSIEEKVVKYYNDDGSEDIDKREVKYNLNVPSQAPGKTPNDKLLCLSILVNECWVQPILVLQNKWEMGLLNAWDGATFDINTKTGVIMSNVLTAGVKDDSNTFTGIIAGEIQSLDTTSYHNTGVFGFKGGKNIFRLTDEGEFYVGNNENNRIHLDKSGNLFIDSDQLKIEATSININANSGNFVIKSINSDYEFKIGNSTNYLSFVDDAFELKVTDNFELDSEILKISSIKNQNEGITIYNTSGLECVKLGYLNQNYSTNTPNYGIKISRGAFQVNFTNGNKALEIEDNTGGQLFGSWLAYNLKLNGKGKLELGATTGTGQSSTFTKYGEINGGSVSGKNGVLVQANTGYTGFLDGDWQNTNGTFTTHTQYSTNGIWFKNGSNTIGSLSLSSDKNHLILNNNNSNGRGLIQGIWEIPDWIYINSVSISNYDLNNTTYFKVSGETYMLLNDRPTYWKNGKLISLDVKNSFAIYPNAYWTVDGYREGCFNIVFEAGAWSYGQFHGTWYTGSSFSTNSDATLKNSICNLPMQYSVFFDKISPKIYKYNDGTSNRFHTGFIAQEIENALIESNINTQDFAGLVKKSNGLYSLRYEEFIALNTNEIQKLKARVTELEQQLKGDNGE